MSTPVPSSRSRSGRGFAFSSPQESRAQWLLFTGWAVALLYFPSGLLHFFLGGKVYARDGFMALHFAASLHFLSQCGLLRRFFRHAWWLLVVPLVVMPAVFNRDFTVEALTVAKWTVLWLDWMIIGFFLALLHPAPKPLAVFGTLTLALLVADAVCGLHEYQSNQFLFPMRGEKSALGVVLGYDQTLGGLQIRLKGLQRDVFSFANLMAASAVVGMVFATINQRVVWRIVGWIWAILFGAMLFISGGRSAFFGVAASTVAAVIFTVVPDVARLYTRRALAVWLLCAVVISGYGVGALSDQLSELFLKHNRAGDSRSAYMRDRNWQGIRDTIIDMPVVVLTGAPMAAAIDSHIEPFYHWADNEYLWFVYHTGVPGTLAIVLFFVRIVRLDTSREAPVTAVVLFLLFIMGEGVARESLSFLGCLPLFVAIGMVIAPRRLSRQGTPSLATGREAFA